MEFVHPLPLNDEALKNGVTAHVFITIIYYVGSVVHTQLHVAQFLLLAQGED